jgi:sugar fermentation stimulation protein A
MLFSKPIVHASLIRRYQRFLADVQLTSGEQITVHCPNPGAMTACCEPGRPVLLSDHGTTTKRKLRYTWEAIHMGGGWVGVNTQNPNHVVAEALRKRSVPGLEGYAQVEQEVPVKSILSSRIDMLLSGHDCQPNCYLEVKNATYREGEGALFPDAVTKRGQKHVAELSDLVAKGYRAILFFFVGRMDCSWIAPAEHVDPIYAQALREAVANGVETMAYQGKISPHGITLGTPLPIYMHAP